MIKWVYNENGAPETRISDIYGTASEVFTEGEFLMLASGRWTLCTNGSAVAGICNQTITAGANTLLDVIQAKEGDVYEAPYTGTPDATFLPGANTVDVSSDGLSVLSSDVTGGALS